ncbi:MAG: tetratricopeptide repeat protein [Bacteroidales bacterium]|nr:tetratricopeptide repeat protein [Bacteroidales bacterium]
MNRLGKPLIITLLLTFFVKSSCLSQNSIDSLLNILNKDLNDSVRVSVLNNLAVQYSNKNINESEKYSQQAYELSVSIKNEREKAKALHNLGMVEFYKGLRFKAMDYFLEALKIFENIEDKNGIAKESNMLGLIYQEQEEFEKALEYFFVCLKIRKEQNDKDGIASINNNIGLVFKSSGELEKALEYFLKSLKTAQELGDKESLGLYYNNIGYIHWLRKNYSLALEYYLQSKKIREELNDLQGLTNVYTDLGNLFVAKEEFEKAEEFLVNSYKLAQQINIIHEIERAAKGLALLYEKTGDFENAYNYYQKHIRLRDSINDQKVAEKIVGLKMQGEFEKEKKMKQLQQEKLDLEAKRKLEKERSIRNMFIVGALGFLIIAIIVYRNFRAKRKDNQLLSQQKEEIVKKNEILNQQNEEILAQRDEIEAQRDLATEQRDKISSQNREITDSILYAKKIQQALFVNGEEFSKILPKSFLFYKPRDIVSGDFYFAVKKGNKTILAVADCTGHGVPGAFMSVLGLSFLNDLVNEKGIERPNVILNQLREMLIVALKQQDSLIEGSTNNSVSIKDGMDMAVVCIDEKNKQLEYAGANSPLYFIRKGKTQIEIIKPDNMPVGIYYGDVKSFSNNTVNISIGDTFYLFTDGFADQFGGPSPEGKKFKYKMFRHLLSWLSTRKMVEQLPALETTLKEWQGKHPQVDDILVLGFRI